MKTVTGNTVRKPYHMLGTIVSSYAAAIAAIGFTITAKPVVNPYTGQPQKADVGLYRSDTNECLGIHSPKFGFIQPAESLRVLESAREQLGTRSEWSSVYVGNGGRTLSGFISLDTCLTAPKRGDRVGLSVGYFDCFDGSAKARMKLCANVLACDNGMVSTKDLVSWNQKHNGCFADRFAAFKGKLAYMLQLEIDAMQDRVSKLDNTPMTGNEVERFVYSLFNATIPANTAERDAIPTRLLNRIEAITAGFTRGTGNTGRTRWDAFNAVTEHLDHGSSYRETENSKEDNRFASLLLGDGADLRERAMALLLS